MIGDGKTIGSIIRKAEEVKVEQPYYFNESGGQDSEYWVRYKIKIGFGKK